jgi:hypothetical protein
MLDVYLVAAVFIVLIAFAIVSAVRFIISIATGG